MSAHLGVGRLCRAWNCHVRSEPFLNCRGRQATPTGLLCSSIPFPARNQLAFRRTPLPVLESPNQFLEFAVRPKLIEIPVCLKVPEVVQPLLQRLFDELEREGISPSSSMDAASRVVGPSEVRVDGDSGLEALQRALRLFPSPRCQDGPEVVVRQRNRFSHTGAEVASLRSTARNCSIAAPYWCLRR